MIGLAPALRARIKQDENRLTAADDSVVEQFGWLCDLLEREGRRVIRELKLALREGVKVFETLQQDTIRTGGDQLVTILRGIPPILEGFYHRLFSSLER